VLLQSSRHLIILNKYFRKDVLNPVKEVHQQVQVNHRHNHMKSILEYYLKLIEEVFLTSHSSV
jgi:hypothetical protein